MLRVGAGRITPINALGNSAIPIFFLPLPDAGAGAVDIKEYTHASTPTFTRATVAWTKLSTGLWAQVASGTARSCYLGANTAVGAYGGYFAEGAGIQLVTPTASIRDMTDASWTKGATITVAKTGTGIDGVVNSCTRLTFGAVAATNTILQTLTAAASSRTYSAFIQIVGTLSGLVKITQDGGSTWTDVTSQLTAANHVRVSLTASVNNASFGIQGTGNGDVIFVDFNQFESGAFATSPMASAGAARNADVLTYPLSGNIDGTNGSLYIEATNAETGALRFVTSANGAPLYSNGINLLIFDGATNFTGNAYTTSSTVQKIGSKWQASTSVRNTFLNGVAGTQTTNFDGNLSLTTSLSIGILQDGSQAISGTIRNIRIYNQALSDAQLQAMTT